MTSYWCPDGDPLGEEYALMDLTDADFAFNDGDEDLLRHVARRIGLPARWVTLCLTEYGLALIGRYPSRDAEARRTKAKRNEIEKAILGFIVS